MSALGWYITGPAAGAANTAPVVANAIPDQNATVADAFSYQFASNTFTDGDDDSLTYTATKSDDSALPSWLTFTSGTRTFSGTPAVDDIATTAVKVTASDGTDTVSDTFNLSVSALPNQAPVVASAIPNQTATEDVAFTYAFPSGTFTDPDGDVLFYDAALASGAELPSWLAFEGTTRTFSGTPSATDVGTLSIDVTASDNFLTATDNFSLVISAASDEQVAPGQTVWVVPGELSNKAPNIPVKHPDEIVTAGVVFGRELRQGVTLTGTPTVTVDVGSGLTVGTPYVYASSVLADAVTWPASETVAFQISGGTTGTTYVLQVTATTSTGETLVGIVRIKALSEESV